MAKSASKQSKLPSNNAPSEPKRIDENPVLAAPVTPSTSAPASSPVTNPTPVSSVSSVATSKNPRFILDPIMPTGEVHLIGGPSGAGKTTFLFQMIEDWALGNSVLGFESNPRPFLYVPCDRSEDSTKRTIERIGCKVPIPIFSLVDNNVACTIDNIAKLSRERLKVSADSEIVLFIDAFGTLVPGGKINDYATVGSWLREVNRKCKREKMTIVGLGHSTKTKEGEKFDNPRQRFLGSVAWGGFVETMIFIEPESADDPTNTMRRILVLPRNSRELCLHYHFNDSGRLVDGELESTEFQLQQALENILPGEPHPTEFFMSLGESISIPKRTVERWLGKAVDDGSLEKVKKGIYRRPRKN